MIKFLFNLTFIYPIKIFIYSIVAFFYIIIFMIEFIGWAATLIGNVIAIIFYLLKDIITFIVNIIKKYNNKTQDNKPPKSEYQKHTIPAPPQINPNIKSVFPNLTTTKVIMKDIYINIYLSKYYAKKLMKDYSFNPEILGLKDYDCPPVDIYDEEDYYKFEMCEDGNYLAGKVTYLILKYTKGKARCDIGYNEQEIKYKYTYNFDTDRVLIDGYTEKELDKKINKTVKEFNDLYEQVDRYKVLSEDENAQDKVVKFFETYNADFYLGNTIKELTDKNIITLELSYIEEYLKVLRIAKKKFIFKDKPLVFETTYIIEEPPKEKESLFKTKSKEKEMSWKEKEFEREAKLWGLSEEDKRIAKEERMSPADFIEAEERDDDELVTDEWE